MSGARLLSQLRDIALETTRILLTGETDFDEVARAVNEGQTFRLLRKPCTVAMLVNALREGVQQHRLAVASRELLDRTVSGCVEALGDVLALVSPVAYGRSLRAKGFVGELAAHFGVRDRWQVEAAAMLSQIGYASLPPLTLERIYNGEDLSGPEKEAVDGLPWAARKILGRLPTLEPVLNIIVYQDKHYDGTGVPVDIVRGDAIPWGARALKVALDYDLLENSGHSPELATDTLRGRPGWYDPEVLEAFAALRGNPVPRYIVHEIPVRDIRPGMIFGSDVRNWNGAVLIAHGQTVTEALLHRLRNLPDRRGWVLAPNT
jgi:response regulator RpfG family c-di-GMP phosphodiesterase